MQSTRTDRSRDLEIAPATPADAAEILALYRACVDLPGCTWNEDYPAMEIIREDLEAQSLYCARWAGARGAIVAAAYVGPYDAEEPDDIPWPPLAAPFALARIGVLPEFQGRGVGARMLRAMLAIARERGADGVRLLVAPDNAPALALYLRAGFEMTGKVFKYGHEYLCCQRSVREEDV